jgi:hypothetical protein
MGETTNHDQFLPRYTLEQHGKILPFEEVL